MQCTAATAAAARKDGTARMATADSRSSRSSRTAAQPHSRTAAQPHSRYEQPHNCTATTGAQPRSRATSTLPLVWLRAHQRVAGFWPVDLSLSRRCRISFLPSETKCWGGYLFLTTNRGSMLLAAVVRRGAGLRCTWPAVLRSWCSSTAAVPPPTLTTWKAPDTVGFQDFPGRLFLILKGNSFVRVKMPPP